ncbi:hypothetical protein BH09ACT12_BH09ACT12_07480 [soil metagenome]
MEDVAAAAGLSSATAYNRFGSKHALMGHVYLPIVESVLTSNPSTFATANDAIEAVEAHVRALCAVMRRNQSLTVAFIGAVQDATVIRRGANAVAPADDPDDPRAIVPLPKALAGLIEVGQTQGFLRTFPAARDIAGSTVNLLLLRIQNYPAESADSTAEITLTLLFGMVAPHLLVDAGPEGRPFAKAQ